MIKQDFQTATQMLITWKNSFDDYLKNDISSKDVKSTETNFIEVITQIFNKQESNPIAKNLNFQSKKIIQIASDIQSLKSVNDDTLPDWLEDELEAVFQKIKDLLATLEKELD